jgi:uncharacterized protein (TIGR03435 family)
VDLTGLKGQFDVDLKWGNDLATIPDSAADAQALYSAVNEQLGLLLKRVEAPTPVVVIDHIERPSPD